MAIYKRSSEPEVLLVNGSGAHSMSLIGHRGHSALNMGLSHKRVGMHWSPYWKDRIVMHPDGDDEEPRLWDHRGAVHQWGKRYQPEWKDDYANDLLSHDNMARARSMGRSARNHLPHY